MQELIVTIVKGLVDDKDAVSVTVDEPKEDGTVVYHLHVAADDMGRVIGKQGRIANRYQLLSFSLRLNRRLQLKSTRMDTAIQI